MSTPPSQDPSVRLKYDASQIQAYLDTIALPSRHRESPVFSKPELARTITYGLPLLAALQKYQLVAIPFENLALHYNSVPSVTIQADFVHDKFITTACGRGGRCMENNLLFYTVLLSIGFNVTSIAGRVNEAVQPTSAQENWPGPRYDGWNHRITLVRFTDDATVEAEDGVKDVKRTFLVDTGFGAKCPTKPLELNRDVPTRITNMAPKQESRIRWTNIPDNVNKSQLIWVYEFRYDVKADWIPAYCFSETEFLPNDYAMMSFFTSHNPKSWFTYSVVCVKMVMGKRSSSTTTTTPRQYGQQAAEQLQDSEVEDEIVGDVTLFNNEVKRRVHGEAETVERLETEDQRVAALKKWFGISLTDSERDGIKGKASALS
ncbi:hypothetical protein AAFC00_000946 [Neodothiora populina]|uniref:Arylamine N-acetyltransferase n=1 Tax=Neodothiora populina TaxID=2781224 RepID=A0ABR3PMB9_9PEZI